MAWEINSELIKELRAWFLERPTGEGNWPWERGVNLLPDTLTHSESWQAGTTLNDLADDTYGPALWNVLNSSDAPDISGQAGGSTDPFTTSFRCTFDAAAQQAGIVQFLTAQMTRPLRGAAVSLSADLWGTNVSNLRMAVVVWTSTADTVTSDIVSAWAVGNPTLAANWAYIGTPASIAITSTRTRYNVANLVIPTNAVNLGVFIWTPDSEASGDLWEVARVKLEPGPIATEFVARTPSEELAEIQRFFYYQPALGDEGVSAWGWCQSTTICRAFIPTPVTMFKTPVVTGGFLNVKTNGASNAVTSFDTVALMNNGIRIRFNVAAGLTVGHAAIITPSTTVAIALDARL